MDKKQNGRFRKKKINFSMISNDLIHNFGISLKAKGLYCMIQSFVTIPNFVLYKSYLQKQCIEGERAFDTAWRELKNSGYLVQYKLKGDDGKYYYEYELLDKLPDSPQNEDNGQILSENFPADKPEKAEEATVQNGKNENDTTVDICIAKNVSTTTDEDESIMGNLAEVAVTEDTAETTDVDVIGAGETADVDVTNVIEQIGYTQETLTDEVYNIALIMADIYNTPDEKNIRVNQDDIPCYKVKRNLRLIEYKHIDYIRLVLKQYSGRISNIRNFMITVLYNAPTTCDLYFKTIPL